MQEHLNQETSPHNGAGAPEPTLIGCSGSSDKYRCGCTCTGPLGFASFSSTTAGTDLTTASATGSARQSRQSQLRYCFFNHENMHTCYLWLIQIKGSSTWSVINHSYITQFIRKTCTHATYGLYKSKDHQLEVSSTTATSHSLSGKHAHVTSQLSFQTGESSTWIVQHKQNNTRKIKSYLGRTLTKL